MKRNLYNSLLLAAAISMTLAACTSSNDPMADGPETPYIDNIEVTVGSRALAVDNAPTVDPTQGVDVDKLIPYDLKFDENSIIQVSQQTPVIKPYLSDDNIYDFSFKKGSTGSWEDELSYNFEPWYQDEPLEWNKVQETGPNGNGYSLYCMYFPVENKLRKEDREGTTYFSVMTDQSTIENLKKSDILGANHYTQAIFSRIRFKLFHLMTYVRVRLYVPVFDEEKRNGYREDALQYATIDNINPEFRIQWDNAVSPDFFPGPPVVVEPFNGSIRMFEHPLKAGEKEHQIVKLKYKDFLPKDYYEQGIEGDYDYVRVYDFSVLIPNQEQNKDENGVQAFNKDFLHFYLRTNSGATTTYYFNPYYIGSISGEDRYQDLATLNLSQGYFQYMELYLPRVGNEVIFLTADVTPWHQVGSEMLLHRDEDDKK